MAAALDLLAPDLPVGSRCALIFPDGGAGYLRTVYDDAWVAEALDVPAGELAHLVGGASASV